MSVMDKPVISTWGIGPTYRQRVKENILEAMDSGYADIMDYVILTDDPSDFTKFAKKTKRIKAVVDIHKEREAHPWSPQFEHVPPKTKNEKLYADVYLENLHHSKSFSYSLHRFVLPTLARLGYTKFVFMDADVKIKYDKIDNEYTAEEFWQEFETTPDTMKGCVAEEVYVDHMAVHGGQTSLLLTRAMGSSASMGALQLGSIILNDLYKQYNMFRDPILLRMPITEGPFRYYHFGSPDKVQAYFNIWNEVTKQIFTNPFLLNYQRCGGYMICDYMPVAISNIFHEMKVENFPNRVYQRRIYYEDRYFIPPPAAGLSTNFIPASSKEEFFEKNKELVNKMVELKAWPHIEPY